MKLSDSDRLQRHPDTTFHSTDTDVPFELGVSERGTDTHRYSQNSGYLSNAMRMTPMEVNTCIAKDRPMIDPALRPSQGDFPDEEEISYQGQTFTDIIQRQTTHELAADKLLCTRTQNGQAFIYNNDDQHLLNYMVQLWRVYDVLLANEVPPVIATLVKRSNRRGFKLTKSGKEIVLACKIYAVREEERRDWQQAYAHHRFHPVIATMLRAVMRWWSPISSWGEPSQSLVEGDADMEAVEALQRLVAFVRQVCRSQAFQNRLHDHERKAKDNFRSGFNYITELFEKHARLLVLRIDLYFRPDEKGWGYTKAADNALTNYLRALRLERIVPGYLGFVIKRENGISRGMHYHLLVFLDGHLHRRAYHLTQVMGEAWMKRVGGDKGSYFNCYGRIDRYRYNGLGLVHVSDWEKLLGLRIALWYLSKQDCELQVDDSKVKNFWRGWKVKGDRNRGAPRQNGDGMGLVRKLLGGERSKYPPDFDLPSRADRTKSWQERVPPRRL